MSLTGNKRIQFGLFVPQGWRLDLVRIPDAVDQYEAMTRVAQTADRFDYDAVWLYDHFHTTPMTELETTFECWTTTAALARDTKRVRVGQMVTCAGYRNPALLAKMASTVDVMSHGRLYFGLGAGWHEEEWNAYGYDFPEIPERMGRLREALEIVRLMWTEDYPRYDGKYHRIDKPVNEPKSVQKPHPPIWIGGSGEQVTLKLVARYAYGCNISTGSLARLKEKAPEKLAVLRRHCETMGRDYDEITKSSTVNVHIVDNEANAEQETAVVRGSESLERYRRHTIVGRPDTVVEQLGELTSLGIDYFVVYLQGAAYQVERVEQFATEVIPRLSQ